MISSYDDGMESRKLKKLGRPPKLENRTRTRNLVIRMSDKERETLDVIAADLGLVNASEAFRFLVHREADRIRREGRS